MDQSTQQGQSTTGRGSPYSLMPDFSHYASFCENISHPRSFVFEKRQLEEYVRLHQRDPVHSQRHALTNFVDTLAKLMDERFLIIVPNPLVRLPRLISENYIVLDAYVRNGLIKRMREGDTLS